MTPKFQGAHTYRLNSNPKEKLFADAWQEQNRLGRFTMLEQLLSDDGGKTPADVSDRDEMIAATVIQWLGSPVGSCFLRDVLAEIENCT